MRNMYTKGHRRLLISYLKKKMYLLIQLSQKYNFDVIPENANEQVRI